MEEHVALAYAHGPALSAEEAAHMDHLQACNTAVGGCAAEWEDAFASGLTQRDRIASARYTIPEYARRAAALPLGAERTSALLVALLTAEDAETVLGAYLRDLSADEIGDSDGALQMRLVSADLQQALICDAADLASGRRAGMVYDPAAPVPEGP